jgi:AAA ATPase domain
MPRVSQHRPDSLAGRSMERRRSGLRGREREQEALDRVLASLRSGRSEVLVVRGEAGMGKTALLAYLIERATGCLVLRATGVQAEMELAFAGLQQLFGSVPARLERLTGSQREAIEVAFGLHAGPAPDRFVLGVAVLGLLAELAE